MTWRHRSLHRSLYTVDLHRSTQGWEELNSLLGHNVKSYYDDDYASFLSAKSCNMGYFKVVWLVQHGLCCMGNVEYNDWCHSFGKATPISD